MGYIKNKYLGNKKLTAVSLYVWFIFTSICVLSIVLHTYPVLEFGYFKIVVFLFPFLLMAGLYGYLVSMISFIICFLICILFKTEQAYTMSVYLIATFGYSIFSQYFWFKSKLKTFLASLFTTIVTTIMSVLCFVIVDRRSYTLNAFKEVPSYFLGTFLIVSAVSIILYVYLRFVPDRFKVYFPLAYGYTKEFQKNGYIRRYQRKTKVSIKITTIIILVELILSLSVASFVPVLFPDLKAMLINNIEAQDVNMEKISDEKLTAYIEASDFRMTNMAVSFDLKMCLLMLCVGVPMAAIANYYTKTKIGGPLGLMSDFMHSFVLTKDEDKLKVIRQITNIQIKTGDEMEVLADYAKSTLLEMADYIERYEKQQKLEAELEITKQASEAKSSFLSNMSHEIRTPINAIIGMNEMIIRECEDDQILEYANNAKSAGNSLLSLVNDILDFSKIEAGKMEILPVQYDLSSMINDLVNLIAARAEDKGLELEINVDSALPCHLIGDEIRLKQVVTNLLTNAVKYTESGKVALSVTYEKIDDKNINLHFEVSDTGIGIKEEDISKLYSPFERIEEIRNRTIEGTGLGMSIVRKLLALMDTKLIVESQYGTGSSFRFFVKQVVVSWDEIGNFKDKYKEFIATAQKYHQRFQAPNAEILVVDDTEMNLTVIKSLLKKTLVQVDTAVSGFETLEKVVEKKYDIIFLDHRMPEMDGVETFKRMKVLNGNKNKNTPVIALTANAVSGAKQEYQEIGFNDYLAKPVNTNELERMIEHYLPQEKIESVSIDHGEDFCTAADVGIPEDSFLKDLKEVDLNEAIINCGGPEVLENVVKDFLVSLDSKADAIEGYLNDGDIRNYTVFVHALKSSARLIGAMELSKMAAELEQEGNDGNLIALHQRTPELLEKYRSYKENLKAALEEESDEDKPEISEEELKRAFKDIKELAEAYNYDAIDYILSMLGDYKIPEDYKETFNKIKQCTVAVDRDGLLELL
ncbi:Signal transduction histidine kinase [Pseudobutyrivibrio xylanivorans]|uniref:Circadian input-output histidine kinase CikA n=2 Tax=Pseudobutyrivibrio xylanivorans TaxID=185007 RepID=A0A1G5RTY8_PSEXY|nr:Signal transduction histidine kinase [Pseudobutyrivibrio xylanivorans]